MLLYLVYLVVMAVIALAVLEGAARYMGLGNPLLYYNDSWGGMRPVPNQQVKRFDGATVTIDENGFRSAVPDQPGVYRVTGVNFIMAGPWDVIVEATMGGVSDKATLALEL